MNTSSNSSYKNGIFLVIPIGETKNSVSLRMLETFDQLNESDLQPTWVEGKDCLKVSGEDKSVFVCDPFSGDAFKHLCKVKSRILGPLCILTCIENKTSLPNRPRPVFSLNMRNVVVGLTNVAKSTKESLKEMIQYMGGECPLHLTLSCTHLVIGCVGSQKYHVAIKNKLPIMTTEWVFACWKDVLKDVNSVAHSTNICYDSFKCKPFYGLSLSASQFTSDERRRLQTLIEENDGRYSGAMKTKETTHLILEKPEGPKFTFAQEWKVKCVKKDWVLDCISEGCYLPEDNYEIKWDPSCPQNKASTPKKGEQMLQFANVSMLNHEQRCDINETYLSNVSFMPARNSKSSWTPQDNSLHFLEGCRIFISGLHEDSKSELELAVNLGRGTLVTKLSKDITHVVLTDKQELCKFSVEDLNPNVHLVSSNWLKDCQKENKHLSEENYRLSTTNSSLPNLNLSSSPEKAIVGERVSLNRSKCTGDGDQALEYQECESSNVCIFSGMHFTFMGFNESDEELLAGAVKDQGGIVHQSTKHLTEDYVCVLPFMEMKKAHLKHKIVRTECWLQMCLEQGCVLPVNSHRLFVPISVPEEGKKPLKDCILAFSQITGVEKECLVLLSNYLGATFSEFFLRKANEKKGLLPNTHLILDSPEGVKYTAAEKWGVPALHKEWLYQASISGERPSEKMFTIDKPAPEMPIPDCLYEPEDEELELDKFVDVSKDKPKISDVILRVETTADSTSSSFVGFQDKQVGSSMRRTNEPKSYSEEQASSSRFEQEFGLEDTFRLLETFGADNRRKISLPFTEEYTNFQLNQTRKQLGMRSPSPRPNKDVKREAPGPLVGVVLCVSRKLASEQAKWHSVTEKLGGKVSWNYDNNCTHLIHIGKATDHIGAGLKELRLAQTQSKYVVSPEWLLACEESQTRVDEAEYPYNYNPRMSLSGQVTSKKISNPLNTSLKDTSVSKALNTSLKDTSNSKATIQSPRSSRGLPHNKEPGKHDVTPPLESAEQSEVRKQLQELMSARKSSFGPNVPLKVVRPEPKCVTMGKWTPPILSEVERLETQPSQNVPIMWEDLTEKQERERLAERLIKGPPAKAESQDSQEELEQEETQMEGLTQKYQPRKFFLLSAVKEDVKAFCINAIEELGGELLESYDMRVTHLICDAPSKNEKFLSCLAAGVWIVRSEFIYVSRDASSFVSEEKYEWGSDASKSALKDLSTKNSKLAMAPHLWREKMKADKTPAFHNWEVKLLVPQNRLPAYMCILKAGGAGLVDQFTKDSKLARFVFVEGQLNVNLKEFTSRGVICARPEYFSAFLMEHPPPQPELYPVRDVNMSHVSTHKRSIIVSKSVSKKTRH